MADFDVIVVGAGPAGLAFVRALADSGLTVGVVERQDAATLAAPPADGREIALTHRSIATLDRLGAWGRLPAAEIHPLRGARVHNGRAPFALAFDPQGGQADRLGNLVSNHLIRAALFGAVAGQEGVTLLAGSTVAEISADRRGARVTLADGRTLRARLLVGADSRFSFVRQRLGIAARIHRPDRAMLVTRLTHEADNGGLAREWFDYGQTIAMLPLGPHRCSAVVTLPTPGIERLAALPPEALAARIARRFGHRLGAMAPLGPAHVYPLAMTYARHFVADGAALIGDAAVGMHPVTAHGFNLGLRSAHMLGALLTAAAARGARIDAPVLLRRYEARHRLATRPLYSGTNALVRLYTADRPPARLVRHAALAAARIAPVNGAITRTLLRA